MPLPLPPFLRPKPVPGVLASFEHIDSATDAIKALRSRGYRDLTVYSSHPNHELDDALDQGVSPVRLFTLIGGITGVTAAFAMQIWMNLDWPLLVGGKPIVAIPAFVVIGFELTVLVASLLTLFSVAGLSLLGHRRGAAYDPRFSDDRIGIFVPVRQDKAGTIEQMLREAGAVEVRNA